MSHITSVDIALKDMALLKRALSDLGMDVREGGTVEVYDGSVVAGDLTVHTPGTVWERRKDYGVAFVRSGDGFEAKADWDAVARHESMKTFNGSQEVFLDAVGQTYSKLLVEDELLDHGFTLEEEETVDGKIILTATSHR